MLSSKTYYELQWQAYFMVKWENVKNLILTELKLCYCLEDGEMGRGEVLVATIPFTVLFMYTRNHLHYLELRPQFNTLWWYVCF